MDSKKKPTAESQAPQVVHAEFIAGATSVAGLPAPALAEFAFAGRSNVGKSSLLNALMQRRNLARSSRTPGCTRQLNVFDVRTSDGLDIHFVDLPGYGYAKISKTDKALWGPMLDGYLRERPTLRGVAILADVRRGLEEEEKELIKFLQAPRAVSSNKPVSIIVVATKIDKLSLSARKPAIAKMERESGESAIPFSAVTGDGCDLLWRAIRKSI